MFSLQTIFGSGKQFYVLLDEAAQAAHESTVALYAMLKAPEQAHALDAFKLARQRERAASDKIGQALVDSFITPIEREDIEALASALYKIPKQVEKFADGTCWPSSSWPASTSHRVRRCSNRPPPWWWTWLRTCRR